MLVKEISKVNGDFNYWDDERIKGAFKNGNGTKKDMLKHIEWNKKYATFIIIEE